MKYLVILAFLFQAFTAAAQGLGGAERVISETIFRSEIESVNEVIERLVQRIEDLEHKVSELSASSVTPNSSLSSNTLSSSLTNWRRLQVEMSKLQVRSILGEPLRIDNGGTLEYWYYGKSQSTNRVAFMSRTGLVYGWAEP